MLPRIIRRKKLCEKLEIKEGEKEVLKLGKANERRTGDLGNVRCIKDKDSTILVDEAKIKGK